MGATPIWDKEIQTDAEQDTTDSGIETEGKQDTSVKDEAKKKRLLRKRMGRDILNSCSTFTGGKAE